MIKKPVKAAAKVAGAARQAKAKLTGEHGVLNTLAKEHGEVSALLKAVLLERKREAHMRDDKVAERVRLLDEIVLELLSHAIAEEKHVYSVLARIPEAAGQVRDSRGEHHRMEELTHVLLSVEYSSPRWLATFEELIGLVEHHVEEEEGELFRVASQHLSKQELKEMDARFLEEKARQRVDLAGAAFSVPR